MEDRQGEGDHALTCLDYRQQGMLALAIGVSAAFGFTAFLSSLLFGVEARDPITMVGVAVLLAAIGIIASALPAWRASRVEPSRTLRALD